MGLLSTLKKNWKLMRIMKRIGKPCSSADLSDQVVALGSCDTETAESELFDLVCSNRETKAILNHYGVTRTDLQEYYQRLTAMGLGRWIGGNYASAAAIALNPTLIYLLDALNSPLPEGWSEDSRWMKITSDLVIYFQSGSIQLKSSSG